ncbi:hypothetical protein HYH03_001613 [Edaphochlamys debaryana]|uniref:Ankyrin repeat domain-containing protein n=1 Tax=Edaphochlamys debaryana TaxID=47281 RepID=A0A835YDB8_9CHLO|nr:hypothetical protein HYH03_001613 [Edaphochlamys debaryana]|eukprot:KAG2500852.1 hypothetical protein HYH03_001613 [Edaphochlamys debaryana]
MSSNEVACLLRRVCKATADAFKDRAGTIHLSRPVPCWAFAERWRDCKLLTRGQREQLVALTAASNVVPNLALALASTGLSPSGPALMSAIGAGALDSCRWLTGLGQDAPAPAPTGGASSAPEVSAAAPPAAPLEPDWGAALRHAARCGQPAACSWCLERCPTAGGAVWVKGEARAPPDRVPRIIAEGAARGGHVGLMEAAVRQVAAAEASMGSGRVLRRARSLGGGPEEGVAEPDSSTDEGEGEEEEAGAEAAGRQRDRAWWRRLCVAALEGCDLPAVQHLCRTLPYVRCRGPPDRWSANALQAGLEAALRSPTPDWADKVTWLAAHGARLDSFAYGVVGELPEAAAVERFAWLQARGMTLDTRDDWVLGPAVSRGSGRAVEWLLAEGVEPGPLYFTETARLVAEAGHGGVLRALQGHPAGGRLDPRALAACAARGGSLEVLQWACDAFASSPSCSPGMDVLLSAQLFTAAASSGSVTVLRWLAAQGCASSERAWAAAVESGCEGAVELLAELGCPKPAGGAPYIPALKAKSWSMLSVLRELGVSLGPSDGDLCSYVYDEFVTYAREPLRALQWLAAGCTLDWARLAAAAEGGWPSSRAEVAAWIRGQREGISGALESQ